MTTLFHRNPRLLALVLAMIIVGGLSAFQAIPRLEDPVFHNRFAQVITPFPGASATRVESLVSEKLEAEIRKVAEVKTVQSFSRTGLSFITIELRDEVTASADIFSRIRDKIDDARASLPEGVGKPEFDSDRSYAYTMIAALTWDLRSPPVRGILRRHALELQDRLRNTGNTALVRVFGAPEEEILVTVDPVKMASLRLTAADLSQAIRNADAKVSAGQLRSRHNTILFEVTGALGSLARIREIPVREAADGAIIRVGDIATVRRTTRQPPGQLAIVDGRPAVVVAARMAYDQRVDRWSAQVHETLAAFKSQLSQGMTLKVIFSQGVYIDQRLDGLLTNLLIGAGLVVLILFLTLGWRNALIVASTLPLTSFVAITSLNMFGVPIHQMSVIGLIVALGLLVDNAIVMVDMLRIRRLAGVPFLNAIDQSVRHLWAPLAASTATTILAFLPVMIVPGPTGEFIGAIGISVTIALITSYLLSLTVIPALAGRFMRIEQGVQRWWRTGIRVPALTQAFRRSLDLSLANPWKSIAVASLLPFLGFAAAGSLTEQFFPPADRDQFHVELQLPGQASIERTHALVKRAEALLRANKDVKSVHWFVGASAPSFYYNLLMNKDGSPGYAQAIVKARSVAAANRMIPGLQTIFDRELPEARTLVKRLEQGPPFDAPIEIRIYGPDLQTLRRIGETYRVLLTRIPAVTHTATSLESGTPKIWFKVDEDKARLVGLRLVDIARQLDLSLEGAVGGSIVEGTEVVPVRLRAGDRSRLDRILATTFVGSRTPTDASKTFPGVPLAALGTIDVRPMLRSIPRRNGRRVNSIKGYLRSGVLPQSALNALKAKIDQAKIALPPGYRVEFGGESEKRNESVSNLMASVGLIVVMMIAVIVLSFNSFRLGGVIFLVAAQAMGLGLLSVAVFNYPLGFVVIIGVMGLIGLAINAAIIITAALRANDAARAGDAREIRDTVVNETSRHIISTTITTVGGFMPLILAEGGFWPPFAIAIAGGTALSTVVSFYFVPACFLLIARRDQRKAARRAAREADVAAQPA